MPRLSKNAPVATITDINAYRVDAKRSEYEGGHRGSHAYHGAYADDAHSAMMGMMERLASTLAVHDDNFDAIFADVEWGDEIDYGDDVVAPTAELRDEAVMFLKRLARSAATSLGAPLPVPDVSPTVDGYIDLHWGHGQARELLLCVRGNGAVSFFGRASNGKSIKGTADAAEDNVYLAAWLAGK